MKCGLALNLFKKSSKILLEKIILLAFSVVLQKQLLPILLLDKNCYTYSEVTIMNTFLHETAFIKTGYALSWK